MEAWVTSAVEDKAVNKAIILAGSLRRVLTTRKLVAFTAPSVAHELREKLKENFDLVLLLEEGVSNGWSLEDYAKAQAFSLMTYEKCVFLSPNTLVLRNCDAIFQKDVKFAAAYIGNGDVDSSVFIYAPKLDLSRVSGNGVHPKKGVEFHEWFKNQIPHVDRLAGEYNVRMSFKGNLFSLDSDVCIVNFDNVYPLEDKRDSARSIGPIEKLAAELCWKIFEEDINSNHLTGCSLAGSPPTRWGKEPTAVVGMSFRLPGGNDVDEFWKLLIEGREGIIPLPENRWTNEHTYIPCQNRNIEAGFLTVPVDEFDAKFFGISPKEAEFLDPQQRLLHEVTWEALEDAMIDPHKLKGTQTGVFVGSWIHDYKDMCVRGVDVDFFRIYMGNSIAASAARLSHFLEATGPSIATESGCSSGIAAVDMACKSLRNGDCDLAIACGVNLLLHPFNNNMLEFVMSPDFRCKTFDANANGFARAEACAVLLLKRLSDAVKDGDQIWGLIRGSALTQEGVSKSLGTPTIQCESLAMELALKDAGVHPKEVSYIETHGTGTAVGDPMEVAAITKTYSKGRTEPLVIGSVKTNVGHTESVSGITGIIKVLLSMKNEVIPKHLNLQTLNPSINLDAIPAKIPLEPLPWSRSENKKRIAGVSSFGISGTDGHTIIEEPPVIPKVNMEFDQERPLHFMRISAKSSESMEKLFQKYLDICKEKVEAGEDSEKAFADLAYSVNIGRASFNIRATLVAKNFEQAAKILKEKSYKQADVQPGTRRLCFLFTGQGSQYPSMAKQLYETSPIFKNSFDKCDGILQKKYQIFIRKILWPESGCGDELNKSLYSQTSIFVVEYCLLKLWESWGVTPDYVMGHSLGEFAAAVAAGALTFEDALMLVAERSRLIDSLPGGRMLVIKSDKKAVDDVISDFRRTNPNFWVDYAALNSPDQTVVAGDTKMIEEFAKFCEEKSLISIILAATHAFHSRHMDPILETYRKVTTKVKRPDLEEGQERPLYISGMEGALVDVDSIDADYWVRHTREKVSFLDACKTVQQQEDITLFLEAGPHPVLSALVMGNIEGQAITCLPSLRKKENEWVTLLDSLSKLYLSDWKGEVDWKGFDKFYKRDKVKLPFYPFHRKPVWMKTERFYPKVHPLLGKFLPTASTETVYQNSLTLKSANFAQDHVIGSTVVFPGAGFLEMCLAGGHANVQGFTEEMLKPRRPIILKSLKIVSPLALYDSAACKLQTVLSLNDKQDDCELGYTVGVHSQAENKDGGGVEWIQHASATFLPVAPKLQEELTEPFGIAAIQSEGEKWGSKEFYEKLPEVGLRFGPKFQSLEGGWKTESGILATVKVPEDHNDYLIHPVVADAMFQAVMVWNSKEKLTKKLHVPVQIGEFIWIRSSQSTTKYVYCTTTRAGQVTCILLDGGGNPLAYMADAIIIETTAKLVEGMIQQQSAAMPKLWEEIWKSSPGPLQGAIDLQDPEIVEVSTFLPEEEKALYVKRNDVGAEERQFFANIQNITRLYFLKAFYDLGWKPEVGMQFSVEELLTSLKIKPNFSQQSRFFLRSIANNWGVLRILDESESTFKIWKAMPRLEQIETDLKVTITGKQSSRMEYKMIRELGENLRRILVGDVDPLSILFPEEPSKPTAAKFYESVKDWAFETLESVLSVKLEHHTLKAKDKYMAISKAQKCRPVCRFLEVGAGTGTLTKPALEALDKKATSFDVEYCMTDISAAFFSSAEKTFEKFLKHVIFKKFDMEKDPLEQGFCPRYFDNIYAVEVLHVSKDIKHTLRNLRTLLKPGGMIQINETVIPDERITFVFGFLDGYWQCQDRDFRKFHTTLTIPMWEEALRDAGYDKIVSVPIYENYHAVITGINAPVESEPLRGLFPVTYSWIVFSDGEGEDNEVSQQLLRRLEGVNRKCLCVSKKQIKNFSEEQVIDFLDVKLKEAEAWELKIEGIIYLWSLESKTRDQKEISLPFMSLMKLVSNMKQPPRVYAVARGAVSMDNSDVIDPSAGTLIGFVRSLANENVSLKLTFLDLDPNKEMLGQVDEVFYNLWVELKQIVAFREGLRMVPKLTAAKVAVNEPLSIPSGCERFQLVLPQTRLISDLEFGYLEPYTLKENEVEVQVKAMALNFRDVFAVLKPIPEFEKFNAVGLDYAGVVTRVGKKVIKLEVGQRVIGMNLSDSLSLPSHIKSEERMLVVLREGITFGEGVTLPAVFSTALYCLVKVAKMKKGDTVLIHTASGGVGLVAIQLCKYVGAKVIATAGSRRKRTYLKNLGIEHVFHSRTTDFGKQILEVTNGRGVDIVLNSITGTGFKEASLEALAKNGRFIEMSKLNVWTAEEVKALRPDVFYQVVDLTSLERDEYEELSVELSKFLKKELIKPIAYERFDTLNIRGALNYMQKAKHIGKIVCVMPEIKMEKAKLLATTPMFNEQSTYLVTGGLGGIGWEIVKWMLKSGAKHIAIANRSPPNPERVAQIENWNKSGKHVQVFAIDVGDLDKCKELMETLKCPDLGFPQLRGVMHAAGVLQDAFIENQNWDSFLHTYNPKVNGSWNLHLLTKDLLLEHFVLFSSMAATLGNPGQTNHSASNSFEDSLASYRRSNGLPATSVNWGNWGEVGVATEVDFPGIRPISTSQGLLALETLLKTQSSHIAVLNVESFHVMQKLFPKVKHYVDDVQLLAENKAAFLINTEQFWKDVDAAPDREAKVDVFKSCIKRVVRNVSKIDHNEVIADQTEFQALGIDSLMMLEMKNSLQNTLGGRMTISAHQLKDCNNTEILATTLVDILEGDSDFNANLPSTDELKQLVREDSNLIPETFSVQGLKEVPVEKVKTILLTGATGTVGPYVLRDLTQRENIRKVYCLVRKRNKQSGEERLQKRLQKMQISTSVDASRVEVIEGDITSPDLNLTDEVFKKLSGEVDAVINCAVLADPRAKYWKAPETKKSHVRTVNVLGTFHLILFSCKKKLKHYCHLSPLLTFAGTGENGEFSDGFQHVGAFDDLKFNPGYVLSKHVSERLVRQAILQGIPCKVFRLPYIGGESETGRIDYKNNYAVLRWLASLKIRAMHDLPTPISVIPVDHCAKLTLDIFLNPDAPMEVFNIVHTTLECEQILIDVAHHFGIQMEVVSHEDFSERLKKEAKNLALAALAKNYEELHAMIHDNFEIPGFEAMRRYLNDTSTCFDTTRLSKYASGFDSLLQSSAQVITRDLSFLKREGLFETFGIKTG